MNLPPTDAIMEQFKFEGADCWEYDVDKCMQAYGQLCRNAALEEAAQEFEGRVTLTGEVVSNSIRSLK